MKIDTFPYFPLDVTEEEKRLGFQEMILNLGTVSCSPTQCCRVVARKLSETDVALKWKGSSVFYEHIRFGFRAQFLRIRWPWTKPQWLFLGHSADPGQPPERICTRARHYVGVAFHECAV